MGNGVVSKQHAEKKKLTARARVVDLIKFGLLCLLTINLYWHEIVSLIKVWAAEYESSHGFLIPLLSCYVIWLKRDALRSAPVQTDLKGVAVLLMGLSMLALGYAGFEPFLRRISLIVVIAGLVYFMLGFEIVKVLSFPLGYLLFMIPLPYTLFKSVMTWLRPLDATVAYSALNALGIPIFKDGPILVLPNAQLVVADLCTGILSLIAILALAVFYAYITQKSAICRILLVLIAIPVAILGNIIRIILLTLIVYFFGIRMLDNVIHQFQGTVIFILTFLILILLGRLVKKLDARLMVSRL